MLSIPDEFFEQALEALPTTRRVPLNIVMSVKFDNRTAAAKAGERNYFTGALCRKGHLSDRYTSTGNCVECQRAASVTAYATIKDALYQPNYPAIPKCIASKGKATLAPCMTCERMDGGCKGSQYSQVGNRAVQAFPAWPPLPRAVAKRRGYQVFMPDSPCGGCGVRAWRTVRDDVCCGCGSH